MSVSRLRKMARILDPEGGRVAISTVVSELSGDLSFAVEHRLTEDEPWTVKASPFATDDLAWAFVDDLAAKPIYADTLWQVVEVHRIPVPDTRGDHA